MEILNTLRAQLFLCIIKQSRVIPTVFLMAGTIDNVYGRGYETV